jgi:flavin reductase (DIM6/NTAB) family NADH-FMN oxidoreductase RutF
MNHRVIEPKIFYVGNPVAVVTTISPDGTVNIGPMSSTWVLGGTIVLGWESTAQTLSNLQRDGECVINFPSASLWQQVDAIATLTGHDPPASHKADQFTFTNDKWTPGRFTPQPSELVTPPRIHECPLQCEATVAAVHIPEGPRADMFRIVETTIQRIHASEDVIAHSAPHHIDTTSWEPMLYSFRDYFGTGCRLGTSRRY